MPPQDWLPGTEVKLVELCVTWQEDLDNPTKVTAYGWDQTAVTATRGKIASFLNARSVYVDNDSSVNRITKNETKRECKASMRDFANTSIRFNKKMDDAAKARLGVFPRDTTLTHHPAPTVRPDIVVENTHNRFEHKVRALNSENGKETKPTGVHGVRYAWQISGEKPSSGEDLSKTKFARKSSHIITHTEADKGKAVYYAVCYENSAGDEGPWSPVEEAMIG